jgi:7-cyano-7-deazaguanine tRNA-ribosyltransferase
MRVIAGLSLKNLNPRVWDPNSPHYLPGLTGVMVSYAEFHRSPVQRAKAMAAGLREFLGVGDDVSIYLDNGAFYFLSRSGASHLAAYEEFVVKARPDWHPIPQDVIPTPSMTDSEQRECLHQTAAINAQYASGPHIPVIHVSRVMAEAIAMLQATPNICRKPGIGIGGIVPNLLRMSKAMPYRDVLHAVAQARAAFPSKQLHLFGVGGTATLHLAALLGMDSADSSGWRNRAARGLIQLPGTGDRLVADLGRWRGREPSPDEWARIEACECPACRLGGINNLRASGRDGFRHRAAHNLWVLLREAELIRTHLDSGTYEDWFRAHLDNTIYLPLIEETLRSHVERPA